MSHATMPFCSTDGLSMRQDSARRKGRGREGEMMCLRGDEVWPNQKCVMQLWGARKVNKDVFANRSRRLDLNFE